MHLSARLCGEQFFRSYGAAGMRVLDIGSRDVNGTLRGVMPSGTQYVGVDLEAGPGVDQVVAAGEPLPFGDGAFDAVVSTSCFEHDPCFWETMAEAMRVLRPGGYFYFNAPSNGVYHGFPYDNWRFYPDCGIALVQWLKRKGPVGLVESGTLAQRGDIWNDFYAVFQKADQPARPAGQNFIYAHFTATNVRSCEQPGVLFFEIHPEDVRRRAGTWMPLFHRLVDRIRRG